MVHTQSPTRMYRLWYPLSHLHKCTDYGTHSVTYTNLPTMVPTQSPTRMYQLWYPLSHLHDIPAMGPVQSPLECTGSGSHPVSCIRYRFWEPATFLYNILGLRHLVLLYSIPALGYMQCLIQCSGSGPCNLPYLINLHNLTPVDS